MCAHGTSLARDLPCGSLLLLSIILRGPPWARRAPGLSLGSLLPVLDVMCLTVSSTSGPRRDARSHTSRMVHATALIKPRAPSAVVLM